MADNFIYIPELNPVNFFEVGRAVHPKYFTKHFEQFPFPERGYPWQEPAEYCQVWQTSDIIRFQFISNFDPIIVQLVDEYGNVVIDLPTLIGLPNKFMPGYFAFEAEMALSGLPTGCYKLKLTLGPSGDSQKVLESSCQYIYDGVIENTLLVQYYSSKPYFKDIMFISGIKFEMRVHGWINHDGLENPRKDEFYRNEPYTSVLLNSKSTKEYPAYFGDEFGLPPDITNLLNHIFGCDNVIIDNKPFGLSPSGKFEYIEVEQYRKRGLKLILEEGINRNSRIFAVTTDTTKKIMAAAFVSLDVFGDLSNQGSSNAVPVDNVIRL